MSDKKQDTGKFRQNIKDQFYTSEPVAKQCFHAIQSVIKSPQNWLWIEPSAGEGVFVKQLAAAKCESIALDIEPRGPGIFKQDFLQWSPPITEKKVILFGNPPFGRQSSTAKAFIKKACEFADLIAFILPRSFVKPSMFKCFRREFHLIYTWELPKNAFLVNGEHCDVPCVFQIWEKRDHPREPESVEIPNGFEYVTDAQNYHIAFRRVGVNAGRCHPYHKGKKYSSQSHYFIHLAEKYFTRVEQIIEKINTHEFPSNTVGPRSLSKGEVNRVLNRILGEN